MEKIFIKPAKGVRLWDPKGNRFVPDAGTTVHKNQYWGRRISEGGAILCEPTGHATAAPERPAFGAQISEPSPEPEPAAEPAPESAEEKTSKKKGKK
jgi:hypothetical protein